MAILIFYLLHNFYLNNLEIYVVSYEPGLAVLEYLLVHQFKDCTHECHDQHLRKE